MSLVTQSTLVRYACFGAMAVLWGGLVACGGGSGGESPKPASSSNVNALMSSSANLILSANRVNGVAPLSVLFNTNTSSEEFRNVKYIWNFGDAAANNKYWSYGTASSLAVKANKNIASGPIAAHVFEEPGTYEVTVMADDGLNPTTAKKITITVSDPDDFFRNNTICISNSATPVAGVAGCPIGAAAQLVNNWLTIGTLTPNYKRILLKTGDVWAVDNTLSLDSSKSGPGFFGSFGSGARPKISMNSNVPAITLNGVRDWRFVGLEVTSNLIEGNAKVAFSINQGGDNLILNAHIHDVHFGVSGLSSDGLSIVDTVIEDTFLTNHGIGGYLDRVDRLAVLGSRFSRTPGNHGLRVQGTANSVISHNQFEAASTNGNALTIRGKTTTGATPWSGMWSENIVISNNVIDATQRGGYAFYAGPQSAGHAERLRNILFESNFVSGKTSLAANFAVAEGLSVRNNIFLSYASHAIGLGVGGNGAGSPPTTGLDFFNNSIYKPDTSVYNGFSAIMLDGISSATSGVRVVNNLAYGPGNTRDGATNGTAATFLIAVGGVEGVHFHLNKNSTDAQVHSVLPWSSPSVSNATTYAPVGYALNGGADLPIWTDYWGGYSLARRSMGAISPQ